MKLGLHHACFLYLCVSTFIWRDKGSFFPDPCLDDTAKNDISSLEKHAQPFTLESAKHQNSRKTPNFALYKIEKKMVPCKSTGFHPQIHRPTDKNSSHFILSLLKPCRSTAEEVSFEWSRHRILSTDLS